MSEDQPKTTGTRLLLEKAQLTLTIGMILGGLLYIGRKMESDDNQARLLQNIANDISVMKERNADANAQIKVIGERVSQVEKRLERMESRP
jgi:hypothetical protein